MSERFFRRIVRHPWWVMSMVGLATLFFGWRAAHVRFDNSIEAILPAEHPAVLQDREVKETFRSRELVLIGILSDEGIFNRRTLAKVEALSREIWRLEVAEDDDSRRLARWAEEGGATYRESIEAILENGLDASDRGPVSSLWLRVREESPDTELLDFLGRLRLKLAPVSEVLSLSEVEGITASDQGLVVAPPMARVPEDAEAVARLASEIFDNEMLVDGLVSADSTGTVILVEMAFHYDDHYDLARTLLDELESLSARYADPEEVRLAGVPVVNVHTSRYMSSDVARLLPLVLLVLAGILFAAFRWWRGVLIPLSVVLVALAWTLGAMELLGRPVTLVVSAMPVILVAVGVADGVHLVSEYQAIFARMRNREKAVLATMGELAGPVLLTSLTDMAGFGSLAISGIASIRDFGTFTALGVLGALVFSLTFVPAALVVLKPPEPKVSRGALEAIGGGLEGLGAALARRRRTILLVALGGAAAALLTLPRIQVGSSMVGYFQEDSEIHRASEMINGRFGGTEVLNIVVDTRRPDGLKDPVILARIAELQDTLEARALVGYTTSIADYVKRIHRVMSGGDPGAARIPGAATGTWSVADGDDGPDTGPDDSGPTPSARRLIAQYLLLYENAGGDDLGKLVDFDYRKANIIAQIRTDHTPRLREIREAAEGFAARELGGSAEVSFAGCANLCIVADTLIIPSQLKSLGLAILLVLGLLIGIFRSARQGLLGLLPLALTVLLVFAMLSVFGVRLDAVTALIASIVLGIGIDYSVHFISRYRRQTDKGVPDGEAARRALVASGPAIIFNSLAVAAGFLVLVLSSFWPVIHIGWIVAVTMILAAAITLVLLPATLPGAATAAEGRGVEAS